VKSYLTVQFDAKERALFEASLEQHEGLETYETAKTLGKKPSDVLRFRYIWGNEKLKLENEAARQHQRINTIHGRHMKTLGAPSMGRIRSRQGSEMSDDEVSWYAADFAKASNFQCAACSTRISDSWWKCPKSVKGRAMCDTCG
jgi:hypothetical protein